MPDARPDARPDAVPDAVEPGPSGRRRLLSALTAPPSRGQVIGGVLLAVLGFAAAVQVRATGQDDNFAGARQADLIALINSLALATDRADSQLTELRRTRDSLASDTEATRTALALARQRAATLQILAGTVPAVGPGIRVTVEARDGDIGTDQLLNGLQELRDSGAEAIEINDSVRVVVDTAIEDTPTRGLVVGGQRLEPPYVIDAIGDPDTLASALTFPGGFIVEVGQVGGRVEVKKTRTVEIASTQKLPTTRYAEPVPQE